MNTIDQYNIMLPPVQFLDPGPSLIDGRTEQDWLSFLCDYATLINFYDSNNEVTGSWAPFLLKDPVFLLASISTIRFNEFHSQYANTCNKLAKLLQTATYTRETAAAFNQLFDQLTNIAIQIKRWIYFMQFTNTKYDLKEYVIYHTTNSFSGYFWAIIGLRQDLFLTPVIKGINNVEYTYTDFDSFDMLGVEIWTQNKDLIPYWEVLGLQHPIEKNLPSDIFNAIKTAGDKMMNFFGTIIQHADAGFEKQKNKKSQYPDTTLLRTFVNLLKVHQDQLNGIAKKHLKFYYEDILKQSEKPAVADTVFLCSELAKNINTFNLPAGTLFNAGVDAQKNPILFSTLQNVTLNAASITGGYTLSKVPVSDNASSLIVQPIPTPGALQTDQDGKVQSWPTFGRATTSVSTVVKPGFAFASPMLFLREGQRQISLIMDFASAIDPQLLQNVNYYLSTQSAWLPVTGKIQPETNATITQTQVKIIIKLDATQPPIESFTKNPDGLNSSWPMLKIEFNSLFDQATPPILNSLTVTVNVSRVKTFQLYNDFGALSTKKAYPPFGPAPLVNSNFIIGSSEIFSKPLDSLVIELNWDQLPPDFQAYYQQYNNYINNYIPPQPSQPKCALVSWFKKTTSGIPSSTPPAGPFNNSCFRVNASLLQNGSWNEFDVIKLQPNPDTTSTPPFIPYTDHTVNPQPAGNNLMLFSESNNSLVNTSILGNPPKTTPGDPSIQDSTLTFTDSSKSGFMKLSLSGPSYGFGSTLYPNVVSDIAQLNALNIVNKGGPDGIVAPANPPFAPQLTAFSANYSATYQYTFNATSAPATYPIQCYLYAPFTNYTVYDSSKPWANYNYIIGSTGSSEPPAGISLWAPVNYKGYLFLELSNLQPASALNIFFGLARNFTTAARGGSPDYYYVSNTGWKTLPLLSDGTDNFSCSGIIKVNVPDDISNAGAFMPGNNYWFCIAVNDDPASYSQTVFLKTNGFTAQRVGDFTSVSTAPVLAANTIFKPQNAIPQISATVQPFASFGGKAAEDHNQMSLRVSNRLKTKDRIVSPEDYFRLISQHFDDIYYSKPVFDSKSKTTNVYLVKAYNSWTDPNAFLPMISTCQEDHITTFLQARTSVFTNINVTNFEFQYVRVVANISISDDFEPLSMQKNISQALDIFLSPWISSDSPQVIIDQEITDTQVAELIRNIPGVMDVGNIYFQTWMAGTSPDISTNKKTVAPLAASALMVSSMDHQITCNIVV